MAAPPAQTPVQDSCLFGSNKPNQINNFQQKTEELDSDYYDNFEDLN
jgi:hypothetical protein